MRTARNGASPMRTIVTWFARVRTPSGCGGACLFSGVATPFLSRPGARPSGAARPGAPSGPLTSCGSGPPRVVRGAPIAPRLLLLEPVLLEDELLHEIVAGLLLGVPKGARFELGRAHVEARSAVSEGETPALVRLSVTLGRDEDLPRRGVDEAGGQVDLALRLSDPEPEPLQGAPDVLLLRRELGDRARDDVAEPEDLADLRHLRGARIGAVRGGEILLREDGVELLPLDDPEASVVHERVHDLVRHPLADVLLAPPAVERPVVEVHDRDLDPLSLAQGRVRHPHDRQGRKAGEQLPSHLVPSLGTFEGTIAKGPEGVNERVSAPPRGAPRRARARVSRGSGGSGRRGSRGCPPGPPRARGAASRALGGGKPAPPACRPAP